MKRVLITVAICLAALPVAAADLMAVYQRALQNDPQLREAEATRLAALESKPQALSALLPQLSGNGAISREHDSGSQNTTEPVSLPPCGPSVPQPCAAPGTTGTTLESFPFSGK